MSRTFQLIAGHPVLDFVNTLEERLAENLLAAIDVDDALVEDQVGRGRRNGRRRNALLGRLGLGLAEPGGKISGVAASKVVGGRAEPTAVWHGF